MNLKCRKTFNYSITYVLEICHNEEVVFEIDDGITNNTFVIELQQLRQKK
jgi:hypothetical protein